MEPYSDVEEELEPADGHDLIHCSHIKISYINICLISPFVLASEMIECIYFKSTL